MAKVEKSDAEWRELLTPEQYTVLRQAGTEPAGSGEYAHTKEPGTYHCAGCGAPLFESGTKYESGTGWPSFWGPVSPDAVAEKRDASHGMVRTEVLCVSCDGHLGHVFPDGPRPTGLRYCMNSLALRLERGEEPEKG
ncbi:MAG: peptide-methionine (R)-S-oxide reductase MsrB [Myxococcota bacterium]